MLERLRVFDLGRLSFVPTIAYEETQFSLTVSNFCSKSYIEASKYLLQLGKSP